MLDEIERIAIKENMKKHRPMGQGRTRQVQQHRPRIAYIVLPGASSGGVQIRVIELTSRMGLRAGKLSKITGLRGAERLEGARMTPRGYVPICVGVNDDTKRFIVHTRALADAEFVQLLRKSAEEFGFCSQGVLRIPFAAKDFEDWIAGASKMKTLRVKPA